MPCHHKRLSHLEGEFGASAADYGRLDARSDGEAVAVWHAGERTLERCVGGAAEVVALLDGVAGVGAVKRLLAAGENVVLDEQLGTLAGVNAVGDGLVVIVVDVAGAEAEAGAAAVDIGEVVVVVGDGQVALVLGAVVVGVSDERALPLQETNVSTRTCLISCRCDLRGYETYCTRRSHGRLRE